MRLSRNAIAMLVKKYRAVLRHMFFAEHAPPLKTGRVAAVLLAASLFAAPVQAGNTDLPPDLSGPVVLTEDTSYTVGAGLSGNIFGPVSGPFALAKLGPGTLTLWGDNTFSGGFTLTAGTLTLGHDNALGRWTANADPLTAKTGMLLVDGLDTTLTISGDRTITNHIQLGTPADRTGSLDIHIAPGQTLTFSGVKTTSGDNYLENGGAINVNVPGGALTFSGGGHLVFDGNSADYGGALGSHFNDDGQASLFDLSGLSSAAFLNNSATFSGGGLFSYSLDASSSVTLGDFASFTGNSATNGSGGGLYSNSQRGASTVTLGDFASFTGNSASSNGGGLYSYSDSGASRVTLGDSASFSGNSAAWGGGLYSYANGAASTLTLGDRATFSGNSATFQGGGLYSYSQHAASTVTLGGFAAFTNNSSGNSGGAIYSYSLNDISGVTLGPNSLVSGNQARGTFDGSGGGAIFSGHNLALSGHTLFSGNHAAGLGGAAYLAGRGTDPNTVTLDAGSGPIAFTGNTNRATFAETSPGSGVWTPTPGTPNSLHLNARTILALSGNNNIYLDDPVTSGAGAKNRLTKTGGGFAQFVGANTINTFNASGDSEVSGGTLRVVEGATLNVAGNQAFIFGPDATLAGGGTFTGNNTIIHGTISPDADRFEIPAYDTTTRTFAAGRTTVAPDKLTGTLTISGAAGLDNATLRVDLDASAGQQADRVNFTGMFSGDGQVDIGRWDVVSDQTIATCPLGATLLFDPTVTVNGLALGSRQDAALTKVGDSYTLTTTSSGNKNLTWTGGTDGNWDTTTTGNWTETGTVNPEQFNPSDYITFDDTDSRSTVTLGGTAVQTSGMAITGGSYTFNSNAATPSTITGVTPTADGQTVTGRLDLSTTGTTTLNVATDFIKGTTMTGGTLVVGHDKALGEWADGDPATAQRGMLTVTTGDATLDIQDDRTLRNHIQVGDLPAASGSLDIRVADGKTLTLSGVNNSSHDTFLGAGGAVNVNVPGGALTFSGGGDLVFSGNSANYGGALGSLFGTPGQAAAFDLTSLSSVTFNNNSAAQSGGGLYAYGSSAAVALGDKVSFLNNNSARSGGGLRSEAGNASSTVTFGDHAIFADNTATASVGGGLASFGGTDSTVTFGGQAHFTDNSAGQDGGAIHTSALSGAASVTLGEGAYFSANQSRNVLGGGGAIYSGNNLNLTGHTFFSGNLAKNNGGAAYLAGNGGGGTTTLDAATGPIAFSGNKSGVDFTDPANPTGGTPSSLHLAQNTTLALTGDSNIYFDDPISSGAGGGNSLTKNGAGFAQFAGNNRLDTTGFVGDSVNIRGGTLRIVEDATFDASGGGRFSLGADATLAGGGTITSGRDFVLRGTVSPDADRFAIPTYDTATHTFAAGRATVDPAKAIGMLTLNGIITFDRATLALDIAGGASDLIAVNGQVTFHGQNSLSVTTDALGSYDILVSNRPLPDPAGMFDAISVSFDGYSLIRGSKVQLNPHNSMALQLVLDNSQNLGLNWTGAVNGIWSQNDADRNWTDNPTGAANETRFKNGDTIGFASNFATPGAVTVDAAGVETLTFSVVGEGGWSYSGGAISSAGGIYIRNSSGEVSFANQLAGAGGLFKSEAGTLILAADNTYGGGTTVSAGLLNIGGGGTSGSVAGNIINNASVIFDRSNDLAYGGVISGSGSLGKSGAGTLTLSGNNTYAGPTTVSGGTLVGNIADNTALTVAAPAAYQSGGSGRTIASLDGAGTVDMQGQSLTLSSGDFSAGTITDANLLTKNGAGIFRVGNATANAVGLNEGGLTVATGKTLAVTNALALADGTTLSLSAGPGAAVTAGSASFSGNSTLNISGYSGSQWGDPEDILVASQTVIDAASLPAYTIGGAGSADYATAQVGLSADSKSLVAQVGLSWYDRQDNDAGAFTQTHGSFTLTDAADRFTVSTVLADRTESPFIALSGWNGQTLTKAGDGTLTLTGDNSYSGGTDFTGGTLSAGHSNALGTGLLTFNGGQTLALVDGVNLGNEVALTQNGAVAVANVDTATLSGPLTGAGQLEKTGSGTLRLFSANNYNGGTLLSAGTVFAGDAQAIGSGAVDNQATLALAFDGTFANQLSGTGDLITDGDIAINRQNSGFSGATSITGGVLSLSNAQALGTGAVENNAALALGFDGTFANTLSGAGTLSTDGDISINTANAGFSGATSITGGTTTLTNAQALGTGAVQNYANLALNFDGTFANALSGAGTLSTDGDISINRANTGFSGTTTIAGGTTTLGDIEALGLAPRIVNNSALIFSNPGFSGSRTINIDNYAGAGVLGLSAAVTSSAQWSDLVTFAANPADRVNVRFNFMPGSDGQYLPANGLKFAELASPGGADSFALTSDSRVLGSYQLGVASEDRLSYHLVSTFNPALSKVYSEASAANLAQVVSTFNQRQVDTVTGIDGNDVYAGGERYDLKYDTGSHADVQGNNFLLAFNVWKNENSKAGLFGELFNGSYDTTNDASLGGVTQSVYSDGKLKSHSFGLFYTWQPDPDNGFYGRFLAKGGRSSLDFRANNFGGGLSTFDSGRNFYGISLGGGLKNTFDNHSVDYYAYGIYTRLSGDSLTDSLRQAISLDSAHSMRLLAGARWTLNRHAPVRVLLGAGLDYEFSGETSAWINGNSADTADLKGLSGLFEAGLSTDLNKQKTISLDLSLQGYVGQKSGLAGSFMLKGKF